MSVFCVFVAFFYDKVIQPCLYLPSFLSAIYSPRAIILYWAYRKKAFSFNLRFLQHVLGICFYLEVTEIVCITNVCKYQMCTMHSLAPLYKGSNPVVYKTVDFLLLLPLIGYARRESSAQTDKVLLLPLKAARAAFLSIMYISISSFCFESYAPRFHNNVLN